MKKQLLSIGLSLAVLGGSAVTVMPANATTTPTVKTVTQQTPKQKAQAQIQKLEKENKSFEEQLRFIDLQKADNTKKLFTDNDFKSTRSYNSMKSAQREKTLIKCEVDATNKMISTLYTSAKKKEISKSSADQYAKALKFTIKDSKTKTDRATKIEQKESVIAMKYEKLGISWKIQRPIYEKFDLRKLDTKERCLKSQYKVYTRMGNGNTKDGRKVQVIGSKLSKQVYNSAIQKKLSTEVNNLLVAQRAHNKIVNEKMSAVNTKIRNNNLQIAKLKLVK